MPGARCRTVTCEGALLAPMPDGESARGNGQRDTRRAAMSIGVSAIIAGLAFAAQAAGTMPDEAERATLLQLSVAIPATGASELRQAMIEETAKITSCAEGMKLAERLKARGLHGSFGFAVKTRVPIAALPAPLRDALQSRPVGRATPVFGGDEAARVLIRCEPTFVGPEPVPGAASERRRTAGSI